MLCGAISARNSDDLDPFAVFDDDEDDDGSTAIDCRGVDRTPIGPILGVGLFKAGETAEAFDFIVEFDVDVGVGVGVGAFDVAAGDALAVVAVAAGFGCPEGDTLGIEPGGTGATEEDVLRGATVSRDRLFSTIDDPDFVTVVVVVVTVVVVVVDDLMGAPLLVFTTFGTLVSAAAAVAAAVVAAAVVVAAVNLVWSE